MDRLGIRLSGRSGAIGNINAHAEQSHDVHPYQARRWFKPNDYDEARSPACSTPLQVQMLCFPRNLQRFPVWAVHVPPKGFKGPHWAWYCHHTENPMQVTEAPMSTRPRTGMPSRVSWPVMGGPTTHPTGVSLASGDPSNSLTAR